MRDRYSGRYARFREKYCHLEDGHATERVLARLAVPARARA
jgi:CDP-glycerol glycerophosphotransferase